MSPRSTPPASAAASTGAPLMSPGAPLVANDSGSNATGLSSGDEVTDALCVGVAEVRDRHLHARDAARARGRRRDGRRVLRRKAGRVDGELERERGQDEGVAGRDRSDGGFCLRVRELSLARGHLHGGDVPPLAATRDIEACEGVVVALAEGARGVERAGAVRDLRAEEVVDGVVHALERDEVGVGGEDAEGVSGEGRVALHGRDEERAVHVAARRGAEAAGRDVLGHALVDPVRAHENADVLAELLGREVGDIEGPTAGVELADEVVLRAGDAADAVRAGPRGLHVLRHVRAADVVADTEGRVRGGGGVEREGRERVGEDADRLGGRVEEDPVVDESRDVLGPGGPAGAPHELCVHDDRALGQRELRRGGVVLPVRRRAGREGAVCALGRGAHEGADRAARSGFIEPFARAGEAEGVAGNLEAALDGLRETEDRVRARGRSDQAAREREREGNVARGEEVRVHAVSGWAGRDVLHACRSRARSVANDLLHSGFACVGLLGSWRLC